MPKKKGKKKGKKSQPEKQPEPELKSDVPSEEQPAEEQNKEGPVEGTGKSEETGCTGNALLGGNVTTIDVMRHIYAQKREENTKEQKQYRFWKTQPVPALDESTDEKVSEPVEVKTLEDVRKDPLPLPPGYVWDSVDVQDPEQLAEVYKLLAKNYVEDDDVSFRFDYSPAFLQWALMPPGFRQIWHVGIRSQLTEKAKKKGKKRGGLFGFITGVPQVMSVGGKEMPMVEINFLCVHKKLRSKRLAPWLIKEVTRRVNLQNIWQAVYTAGVVLPRPVSTCRYYHRSLNPKKLCDVGFSGVPPNMTMPMLIKLYRTATKSQVPGIRPMEKKDVKSVTSLLNGYLKQFHLRPVFEDNEVEHWLTPRQDVVSTFVVCGDEKSPDTVTDMVSYYRLSSSIINHPRYKSLHAVYLYYTVANTVPMKDLVNDALHFAKKDGVDVFNCLDCMDNQDFLRTLKFKPGDGELRYYVFNWRCATVKPEKIGLVLL